jgi:signal transduction histidine kinase
MKIASFAGALAATAVVWQADRVTPPELNVTIFYLVPVGFVSCFCGDGWSYVMAVIAAAAWLQADVTTGPPMAIAFHCWNAFVRLIVFLLVSVLSRDIFRLRRLNEKEHAVSELKSELVSMVSHEFGNYLTIYNLSLANLKETEGGGDAALRQKCYANLDRVYSHLSGAVANFLNLHRIESGRFAPHLGEMSLRTAIHATLAEMGPLIEDTKVELTLDFPPETVRVKADPDAVSVIMSNLIGNAYKYTPAGGKIAVRVAAEPSIGTALVTVEDSGIGISEADLRMITSGYYRAGRGKKAAKGFGVGLRVTRELLETLGSRLEIESRLGAGSKFSFRLPLWTKRPAAAGETSPEPRLSSLPR